MAGLHVPLSTLRHSPRGPSTHDLGPSWIATPSMSGVLIPFLMPVHPGAFPTFTRHRSTRSVASSTPTASPRLRRSPSAWPPHRRLHSASELTRIHQLAGHALHPGPYPPALSRHSSYGASPTGSLVVPPSDLACRTRPVWQSQTVPALSGLLPPSPAFPGSGCPQLRHAAATARRRRSLTSTRCHAPRGARSR